MTKYQGNYFGSLCQRNICYVSTLAADDIMLMDKTRDVNANC